MTRGAGVGTSAGTVLGTFGYMAPEQVRGLAVDHRADIFAFGAVLYEMLSGERAFKGETAADTMTAILTKDPPDLDTARLVHLRRSRPHRPALPREDARSAVPVGQRSRVRARDAVDRLRRSSSAAVARGRYPPARARVAWLPWAIAASRRGRGRGLVAAEGVRRQLAEPRWSQFTRITELGRRGDVAERSRPTAATVAYSVRVNGSWDIYSQRVGGRNATPIVNDPQRDEGGAAFSPDGSLIAFHESDDVGGIFVAGATGESVRRVTDIGFDPAWSPDGKQIAFATEEIVDPASRTR